MASFCGNCGTALTEGAHFSTYVIPATPTVAAHPYLYVSSFDLVDGLLLGLAVFVGLAVVRLVWSSFNH